MDHGDALTATDSFDTDDIAAAIAEATTHDDATDAGSQGAGRWWVLLLLVIVFGYLSAARRESLGRFAAQIADIIHDFRGYDPEF